MNIRISLVPFAGSLMALALLAACSDGGNDNDNSQPPSQQEQKLRKVGSASELEAYLKNGLKATVASNGVIDTVAPALSQPPAATPSPPTDSAAGGNGDGPESTVPFSETTLIEEGVDEPDVVKSDGNLIYVAKPANNYCYELCAQTFETIADDNSIDTAFIEPDPTVVQNLIRVMRADDVTHSTTEVARIDIPLSAEHDYQSVAGLMLIDENTELVAISNASSNVYQNTNPLEPAAFSSIWGWSFGSTIIDTFGISGTTSFTHEHRIELDGYLLQARRIENTLYVVTRFTPEVTIAANAETKNAEIDALSLSQLLPKAVVDGNERTQVSPDNCFVDTDTSGYPTLMVVTAIDLDDNSLQSSCVTANVYGFYMSKAALYLTQSEWSEASNEKTHIYKFALSADGPTYRGEGSVEGYPAANQNFSISERNDILRIATTTRDDNWVPTNHLHTLSESTSGDLQTLATLPNAQRPESIGKPGESIQGIRFVGDRAYVVTFLQIDPLYVIDLTDPANPFVAGEVEIPGFSTLLQPLGNDLLLGVGSEDSKLKVELYDVADPSSPRSISKYLMAKDIHDANSYSAASWDHHALALLAVQDNVRIALPYYRYRYGNGYEQHHGALSFSVDLLNRGMTTVAQADATSNGYIYGKQRVLLQPNTLHYIQGSTIWSGIWGSSDPLVNPK